MNFEHLESRRLLSGTALISGSVYDDVNRNGIHEAGEAGIKNVRVYLDSNGNGSWQKGKESSVRTDSRGAFSFEHLEAGTYRLRHVVSSDTTVMAPRSDWFKITLTDGQQVTRRLFGDYTAPKTAPSSGSGGYGSTSFDGLRPVEKPTYYGDQGWSSGDVDYNGQVDSTDYNLVDFASLIQSGTLRSALAYLNGSDPGLSSANDMVSRPAESPIVAPSAKSTAKADFKRTHDDHSLLSAKAWLSGDKNQIRSSGLQTVIDHYHQFGIDYKRAFLTLAKSY